MGDRPRVVIALPDGAESGTVAEWLVADGFEPVRRSNLKSAVEEMQARPFDLLIADAMLAFRDGLVAAVRARSPITPAVVIRDSAAAEIRTESQRVMHLKRPLERVMLICTVSMAIMDGRPTRRSERKLVNRFAALVNGMPSHIIDVSNEGLRLEVPRGRRLGLPPYFNVQVPLIGVAVTVQRMWARPWPGPGHTQVTLCGGALAANRASTVGAWRALVETIPSGSGAFSGVLKVE